jgi:hypothetical protein
MTIHPLLLDDISRCHDASCPQRQLCLPWLDRDHGRSHQSSFNPPGEHAPIPCRHQLRPGPLVQAALQAARHREAREQEHHNPAA